MISTFLNHLCNDCIIVEYTLYTFNRVYVCMYVHVCICVHVCVCVCEYAYEYVSA